MVTLLVPSVWFTHSFLLSSMRGHIHHLVAFVLLVYKLIDRDRGGVKIHPTTVHITILNINFFVA